MSYTCPKCGAVSHNQNDEAERYCGRCHEFREVDAIAHLAKTVDVPDLRPRNWENKPVNKPLVDDLAEVLARTCVGWKDMTGIDLLEAPEVKRVLARYRDWKDQP